MRRIPYPDEIKPDVFQANFDNTRAIIETNYDPCPRCGQKHDNLLLQKFKKPMITEHVVNDRGSIDHIAQYFTHWVMCPVLQEPIIFAYSLRPKKE